MYCRGIKIKIKIKIEGEYDAGGNASMQKISSAEKDRRPQVRVFPAQISTVLG